MQHSSDKEYNIERIAKLRAKVFTSASDPVVAEAWVDKIERVFDVMSFPDDKRLHLATFLLEEGAYDLWQLMQARYADPSVITWMDFKRTFYDTYYPRSNKDAKQNEFLQLVQGSMKVFEYQKKFVELSKYAQVLVADEIDRCKRFEDGLREEIKSSVTFAGLTNFGKLVEVALRVKKSISERMIDVGFGQVWPILTVSRPSPEGARVQGPAMVQYSSHLIADLRVMALFRELLVQDKVRVLVVPDFLRDSLVGNST
ncbi:Gag protease polyprotein-like protein [Abeliophyllum distichum]|uniref:Gag protease polyprotein-like protein n=1 Tax=Abeliophyllum distichum TaxID=126358 RepID=A0ABD1SDF1_9LAMI